MPAEPPPAGWSFPPVRRWPDSDLVCLGGDLSPGALVSAYRRGLFPMPMPDTLSWWSPVRRGVLPVPGMRITSSLRKSSRRFQIRINTAFEEVIDACGDPARPDGWIDAEIRAAYLELHRWGWAHSVEAWSNGRLAGGLYGVAIGGLFAGESMFHRARDASKVALLGLVELLHDEFAAQRVLDVQWSTPHLASLGVVEVTRTTYLSRLPHALALPPPAEFARI